MGYDKRIKLPIIHAKGSLGDEDIDDDSFNEFLLKVLVHGEVTSELLLNNVEVCLQDNLFIVAHKTYHPTPVHTHDFYELAYVLKGSVINCFDGREIRLFEGSTCIMNKRSTHALKVSDPDGVLVNICLRDGLFEGGIFRQFIDQDNHLARFLRGEEGQNLLIVSEAPGGKSPDIVQRILTEYASSGFRQSFSAAGLTLTLLDHLAKIESYSYLGVTEKMLSMLDYIESHLQEASVRSLSLVFGYNESYVSQYVRRHTGHTVTELVTFARMKEARRLLSETGDSIEHIAQKVGYESPSHFSSIFKRNHGMTPGAYRAR